MSIEEIFRYFYTNSANLGIKTTTVIMASGLLIAALIYLTYRVSYRGVAYNERFGISLIIILLVSIVIMLMISSNIVISLGMVGALSIVRYRTAIKDSRDTVFIFWSIAEGLSVGSQNFKLALITTLFIAIIIVAASFLPNQRNKYLVVVTGDNIDITELMEMLKQLVLYTKIRSANRMEGHQEMIFEVRTRSELDAGVVEKLSMCHGVETVNWVAESGENVG